MTIRYKCPECGAALNINDELAGTEGNCPRCESQFVVPAPESETVPQAAAEAKPAAGSARPAGPLSEDDIGDFLSSDPSPLSSNRRSSEPESDDELSAEQANPFDEDRSEAENERRLKKHKPKRGGTEKKANSSGQSASIAQRLMGRGEAAPETTDEPDKKKRRAFGDREERRAGELTSYADVAKFFVKEYGAYAAIGVAIVVGLVWWAASRMAKVTTPPLVQVSGTVTLDGKPVEKAWVKFVPQFEGPEGYLKGSTSFGFTDAAGKYTLTYTTDSNGKAILGAVIAKHQVQIQLNDLGGGQLIPPRYSSSQSDLKVEVKEGIGPLDFPLKSDPVEQTQ